ncbi:MAG: rhomboid family intramembrane serine protease [Bacteroidetes bacterium]|nr:rhomboid family intramembrane serine protease [Bacteroidota bacterium]
MHEEQKRMLRSLVIPGIFVILMWLIKIFENIAHVDLGVYGLAPLSWKGLTGIVLAPLLHADFSHLSANTLPFFFLGGMLFYFYRSIALKTFFLIWLITGLWVWVFARGDSVHIGASGVINGMASFLFLSGILRRDARLMAITLLITFLYGGLVWGVFPQLFPNKPISWESHLMGLLAGILLAFYYRNAGPQRKEYDWGNEEDDDSNDYDVEEENPDKEDDEGPKINYEYKE